MQWRKEGKGTFIIDVCLFTREGGRGGGGVGGRVPEVEG